MNVFKTDEPLVNYAGPENLLVIPITSFLKKDGSVTLIDEEAKLLAEKYPDLPEVFGALMSQGVPAPVYRREDVNVLGIIDREHYASGVSEELVAEGLVQIADSAQDYRNFLVYLFPFGGDEETTRDMLDDCKNVILLLKEEHNNDGN